MFMPWYILLLACVQISAVTRSGICPKNRFGRDCRHVCHCNETGTCNSVTGRCSNECAVGWQGEACQTHDIALSKPASIKGGDDDSKAGLAVDGDPNTCVSSPANRTGWWKLDLSGDHRIFRISITSVPSISMKGWRLYASSYDNVFSAIPCTTLRHEGWQAEVTCDSPTVVQYIWVIHEHGPVHLCDFQLLVCENYTFGTEDCSGRCRCAKHLEICDHVYGTCSSGCEIGWTGSSCQSACMMYYGQGCVHTCGHCRLGQPCDPVTGRCSEGCAPGWTGIKCDKECSPGFYGEGCSDSCGHCLYGDACSPSDGSCSRSCAAGWTGAKCNLACPGGRHGENCTQACGRCRDGDICDRFTGICPKGCVDGWAGIFCNHVCLPGYYGANCTEVCGHCVNPTCNVTSGHCDLEGCKDGWTGNPCMTKCAPGQFGKNCADECGRCKDGAVCGRVHGVCSNGCSPGWNGSQCLQKCDDGFYGQNCEEECGFCEGSRACHHETGLCEGGCSTGYQGEYCKSPVVFEDQSNQNLLTVMMISVAIVFAAMLVVIVCLILKWQREFTQEELRRKAAEETVRTSLL